eukprot:CAMPEP_0172753988 /NCGR_PEP_ID=MMETSP1074-20121228/157041_1 /TAXON_ID=2916 /ORGANISM="Ceratium fusus, Strain PA161109" /LENGTH=59 /DNA_ID=CAMNT_0013586787 /DNA_START=112 /DNA_END=288 /DNA_ORIENTATION=-
MTRKCSVFLTLIVEKAFTKLAMAFELNSDSRSTHVAAALSRNTVFPGHCCDAAQAKAES